MRPRKTTFVWLAAIAALVAAAAPAQADFTYGCTLPMTPQPDQIIGKTVDARGLVMFIRDKGSLEVRSRYPDALLIQPVVTLWGSGGRERLDEMTGKSVQLEPGGYPMSEAIINGIYDRLARRIIVGIGPKIDVISSETLDHDAPLRFPRGDGVVALTLEFVNAKPRDGDGVNSHKLVMFLQAIGETEKNLR